jgi:hypothetical protein
MSESTENTAPSMCDQVLDYAYDELEGDAKAAFEAHLAGCKKCQADLQSMKRVRGAVKSVLPPVEPPANATGALHAQLIHAAAQRASAAAGGGKVIPFGRRVQKVVLSPAFLAAAMFVIVGGAAGTMWWQGKFDMPAKHAEATAPVEVPAPAATPVVTAMPSGATATAEPEKAEKAKAEVSVDETARKADNKKGSKISGAYDDSVAGNEGGEGENKVYLGGIGKDAKPVEVKRAPPAAHAAAKEVAADKPADLPATTPEAPAKKMSPAPEPARPMPKSAMKTRSMDNAALGDLDGAVDSSNGMKGRSNVAPGGAGGGVLGGVASTGDTRSRRDQGVQPKPAAKPAPPADRLAKREEAPQAGPRGGTWNGQVSSLPQPASSAPAAPPPPMQQSIDGKVGGKSSAGEKSSTADQTWRGTTSTKQQQAQPSFASPATPQEPASQGYAQQNTRNYAADRKKALDYADSGRCTDAVKVFEEMQKARWSLSAKEQTAYKRCKARLEEATKQDKNFQNRMMQDAERVHEQNAAEEAPKAAAPAPVMESETQSQSVKAPAKAKKKAAPAADDASTKSGL